MTIFEYLGVLTMNLFLIVGVHKLFQKDMLLGPLGDWMYARWPDMVCKPLFMCPPCMSSWWGVVYFFGFGIYHRVPVWTLPIYCISLCGLVSIIMMIESPDQPDDQ